MAERARLPAIVLLLLGLPAIVLLVLLLTGAGAVHASANTRGPLFRVGSDYSIPNGVYHTGSIIVFGGNIAVDGQLQGRAISVGGTVKVQGSVHGDVMALGGRVVLLQNAKVEGSVTAVGGGVDRADGADLRGEVNSISLTQGLRIPPFSLGRFNLHSFPVYALYLLGLYLAALLLTYLFSDQALVIERTLATYPGRCSLVGALIILLIVPITLAMAFTIVGLPMVLLAWLAFILAKLLGYVAMARATGRLIAGRLGSRVPWPLHLALGVVILGFLRAVPYFGIVFGIFVLLAGLGATFISKFGMGGTWTFWRRSQPELSDPPSQS